MFGFGKNKARVSSGAEMAEEQSIREIELFVQQIADELNIEPRLIELERQRSFSEFREFIVIKIYSQEGEMLIRERMMIDCDSALDLNEQVFFDVVLVRVKARMGKYREQLAPKLSRKELYKKYRENNKKEVESC